MNTQEADSDPIDHRIGPACGVRYSPDGSLRAATSILLSAGCPDEYAALCARNLHEMGITFTSRRLAEAMAEIAQPPLKSRPALPSQVPK